MKERPILFKGEMVRAILEGRKTQTRRMVKPQPTIHEPLKECPKQDPIEGWILPGHSGIWYDDDATDRKWKCPYGAPKDHLWVKETWALHPDEHPDEAGILYRATDPGWDDSGSGLRWKPSIFMPRSYSRITLEIVKVRVERLQEISEEDAIAEGCLMDSDGLPLELPHKDGGRIGWDSAVEWYSWLWESINGEGSWELNPWVWVIEFKRVK